MADTAPPPIVYKYVGPKRIDILDKGLIHFSKLSAMNDPFEGRPFIKGISDDPGTIESAAADIIREIASGDGDDYLRRIYQERAAEGYILTMTEDEFVEEANRRSLYHAENDAEKLVRENSQFKGGRIDRRNFADDVSKTFDSNYGMLCLAASPTNPLMWSHYAEYHKGFCIGFDSAHPFFHQAPTPGRKIGCLIKAAYSPDRPRVFWDQSKLSEAELEDHWITYFMQAKSEHWEYENEYRIIRPLGTPIKDDDVSQEDSSTGIGSLFTLPSNAVASVILGMRVSDDLEEAIRKILSESRYDHVNLLRADIDDEEYAIAIHDA